MQFLFCEKNSEFSSYLSYRFENVLYSFINYGDGVSFVLYVVVSNFGMKYFKMFVYSILD